MRIELENIGMLEKASVKIDGLTVIAGENDTGKSTVGKVLFCVIKAISKYRDFRESKTDKIEDILDELFFFTRRHIKYDKHYDVLRDIFHIREYVQVGVKEPIEYIKKIKNEIKNLNIETDEDKYIDILIDQLELAMHTSDNKQKYIQNALNKVFHSEFNSSILQYGKDEGCIKLYDKDILLLSISVFNAKLELKNEVKPIEIEEVTFIESPLILNNHDLLARSQSGLDIKKRKSRYLGVPYTTLHTKDLFDKLKYRSFEVYLDDAFENEVLENTKNIINGEIVYDKDEGDFVYIKDKQKLPIKNTATGIKAFGIIQLLIDGGFINRTGVVVLDEPEIHLHPKWQLQYSQIIAILVKNNVPVMINSHSPYMVEALKRYSDKEGLGEKSNFYLAKDGVIEDKDKLSEIFALLSEPFEVFRKMDSNILKNE